MSVTKEGAEAADGLDESQSHRDARIKLLWDRLCPSGANELDEKALQKGFQKIDHPLKNADSLLKKIMSEVDRNHDGKIQYDEFQSWVEKAERQLEHLFRAIDKDGNGQLDLNELQAAFRSAGLTVSNQKLNHFFQDMDDNHDGFISFKEWRNFLLFMPAHLDESKLRAVLSYYNAVVNVSPEGDSSVSDETLEGLGTESSSSSLVNNLFGSFYRVVSPMPPRPRPSSQSQTTASSSSSSSSSISSSQPLSSSSSSTPPSPTLPGEVAANGGETRSGAAVKTSSSHTTTTTTTSKHNTSRVSEAGPLAGSFAADQDPARPDHGKPLSVYANAATTGNGIQDEDDDAFYEGYAESTQPKKFRLTDFAPDPGYFLAGAIAGGVSRTATAPLDRLKVYLLVKTTVGQETAIGALKQGRPIAALKNGIRPFSDAVTDLYMKGGLRGFFAGNGLNVIKIMPETAIKFGSYEAAKRALANFEGHGDPSQLHSYSKFTAGGLAGMIAQFCVYPLDTLKFRLQCETVEGGLTGAALVRQTASRMVAEGGLRVWYRGVTMGLIGMFPYSAIDMGTFELLKTTYKGYYAKKAGCHEDDIDVSNVATGIIGATSGAFGATVVYPLNVVRTRLQAQGTAMHSARYTGIWDVTTKTIAKEGIRGLYKGLTPNMLKVAPALSITWVVYENSKKFLGLH